MYSSSVPHVYFLLSLFKIIFVTFVIPNKGI